MTNLYLQEFLNWHRFRFVKCKQFLFLKKRNLRIHIFMLGSAKSCADIKWWHIFHAKGSQTGCAVYAWDNIYYHEKVKASSPRTLITAASLVFVRDVVCFPHWPQDSLKLVFKGATDWKWSFTSGFTHECSGQPSLFKELHIQIIAGDLWYENTEWSQFVTKIRQKTTLSLTGCCSECENGFLLFPGASLGALQQHCHCIPTGFILPLVQSWEAGSPCPQGA